MDQCDMCDQDICESCGGCGCIGNECTCSMDDDGDEDFGSDDDM